MVTSNLEWMWKIRVLMKGQIISKYLNTVYSNLLKQFGLQNALKNSRLWDLGVCYYVFQTMIWSCILFYSSIIKCSTMEKKWLSVPEKYLFVYMEIKIYFYFCHGLSG